MSYNLTLQCGCEVYVSRHPTTGVAHTRIIETRGAACGMRKHEVGARLFLWELLPEPRHQGAPRWAEQADELRWCS
jgi:hypothetical protein